MSFRNSVIIAALVGVAASGISYYVWCSWQWKQAADAKDSGSSVTGTAADDTSEDPADTPDPDDVPDDATAESPHVFSAPGDVSIDLRVGNQFALRGNESRRHVALTADTRGRIAQAGNRGPANVVLVIDRSGSMSGERINHARSAARFLVNNLRNGDALSIVTYSNDGRVEMPATTLSTTTRNSALGAIQRIQIGGGTCISCGLDVAREQLNPRLGGPQRVIVLSDGEANSGIIDESSLRNIARQFDQSGAPVSTIGVGLDYNEALMSSVAVGGNGKHYFVEDPSVLARTLAEEIEALDSLVARRVTATFELAPGTRFVRGFDRDFHVAGNSVTVSLGDMPANVERTALFEVAFTADSEGTEPVLDTKVVWEPVGEHQARRVEGRVAVNVTDDASRISTGVEPRVAARVEQALLNRALLEANQEIRQGNLDRARQVIGQQVKSSSMANKGIGSDKLDQQLEALEEVEAELAEPAAAAPRARKKRAKKNAEINAILAE